MAGRQTLLLVGIMHLASSFAQAERCLLCWQMPRPVHRWITILQTQEATSDKIGTISLDGGRMQAALAGEAAVCGRG